MSTTTRARVALAMTAPLALVAAVAYQAQPPPTTTLDVTAPTARPEITPVLDSITKPVPHPADVAAKAASDATEQAIDARWAVDGEAARVAHDAAVAAAEAEAARAAEDARQSRQDSRIMNHESTSPPLGGSSGGGSLGSTFECIGHYESDGNYAERSNPTYRGKYQMGFQEWRDMGGTGDPADAPPAEQDMRAQMLQAQRGWQPWSTRGMCGV